VDLFSLPPVAALLDLTATGLMALIALLTPAAGPLAAALAIVLLTVVVRTALIPVGIAQAKAEQVRSRLAPRLRELQRRLRSDPERLQRETMKLYREEGASPFAGCVPLLLQTPIVSLVYAVFLHPAIAGHANPLLDETLIGVPLGHSLVGALVSGGLDGRTTLVIGAVVVLIATVGELTRRLLRPVAATPLPGVPRALAVLLHAATAIIAVFVPLAAALYLLTTVAWTLGQRLVLTRRYPPHPSS